MARCSSDASSSVYLVNDTADPLPRTLHVASPDSMFSSSSLLPNDVHSRAAIAPDTCSPPSAAPADVHDIPSATPLISTPLGMRQRYHFAPIIEGALGLASSFLFTEPGIRNPVDTADNESGLPHEIPMRSCNSSEEQSECVADCKDSTSTSNQHPENSGRSLQPEDWQSPLLAKYATRPSWEAAESTKTPCDRSSRVCMLCRVCLSPSLVPYCVSPLNEVCSPHLRVAELALDKAANQDW